MRIRLVNTPTGFVPETDDDAELKRKMKLGKTYEAVFKEVRNPEFNRKFHAMVRIAWEYLPEVYQEKFGNIDNFRYMTEIKAGFCEMIYDPTSGAVMYRPKSTAFDQMTESEFEKVYNGVLNVILRDYLPYINSETFVEQIKWF